MAYFLTTRRTTPANNAIAIYCRRLRLRHRCYTSVTCKYRHGSARRVEAENLFLRHQLSIALRRAPSRLRLRGSDRALLVWMTGLWPSLLGAAQIVQPETILRWHRAGFTAFWRWKSRKRAG